MIDDPLLVMSAICRAMGFGDVQRILDTVFHDAPLCGDLFHRPPFLFENAVDPLVNI